MYRQKVSMNDHTYIRSSLLRNSMYSLFGDRDSHNGWLLMIEVGNR